MERLFVDTGAWYAYFNAEDPDHDAVADVLEDERWHLVTSSYVLDETVTLVLTRRGHGPAVRAGSALRDPRTVALDRVAGRDEDAAWELFKARPDKGYSFTDCTSFVLMDRLGIEAALATDPHFEREGFRVLPG